MSEQIGEAKYKNTENKNLKIEKIIYEPKEQKLFVNDSLYFCGVSEAVWEYKIGGYAVLDKYLKSHKGEEIDFKHFSRIIQALHRSLEIESQIANIKI
ncbi:type ISP restriction/modification enzyme [Helicobacter rodentium]|uniref:type ISP restriction/modification enzyme n=1 Tax=Helicobacter rodentium TaxID=59617 RepID=UPI0023F2725D|nr:type ISP restriction/modification enzyme [Helicobacter rodentium]